MKTKRKSAGSNMRKYYQLLLVIICFISVVTLLIYRHEYYRLRYVLEVLNFFGKPGLSEIEFCGPGFNATLLTEIMRNSSMEIRETPPLFQALDENFYTYSSYVRSYVQHQNLQKSPAHLIDTIAVGKESVTPNFSCKIWLEQDDVSKVGKFSYKIIKESVSGLSLYVFRCSHNKYLGRAKGVSYYTNNYNVSPYHAPISKLIYINDKHKIRKTSRIRFVNNIQPAICVIPNQIPIVSSDSLITFILFHHIIGVDHFTIYDSMISNNLIKRLNLIKSDIKQWDMQFFSLNYPFTFSQSYEILRHVIELDCLIRHFRKDKEDSNVSHLMVMSWDEHLVPRVHVNLKSVLDDFDPLRKNPSIEVSPLLFCLNQPPDDNTELYYPDIFRKTHYFIMPHDIKPITIYNLDAMTSFDDILNISNYRNTKKIPLDQIGMHKYTVCSNRNVEYNKTQMEMFQHKFEGAIFKFTQSFINHNIYRLFKNSKILEKNSNDEVRDIL